MFLRNLPIMVNRLLPPHRCLSVLRFLGEASPQRHPSVKLSWLRLKGGSRTWGRFFVFKKVFWLYLTLSDLFVISVIYPQSQSLISLFLYLATSWPKVWASRSMTSAAYLTPSAPFRRQLYSRSSSRRCSRGSGLHVGGCCCSAHREPERLCWLREGDGAYLIFHGYCTQHEGERIRWSDMAKTSGQIFFDHASFFAHQLNKLLQKILSIFFSERLLYDQIFLI